MRSKCLFEKGCNILYSFKIPPGFQHLSDFIYVQDEPVGRCVSGNENIDMPVIHAGNDKFTSAGCLESVNALLEVGEKTASWPPAP